MDMGRNEVKYSLGTVSGVSGGGSGHGMDRDKGQKGLFWLKILKICLPLVPIHRV